MDPKEFEALMQQAKGGQQQEEAAQQPAVELDPEALQGAATQLLGEEGAQQVQSALDENGVYQGGFSINDIPGIGAVKDTTDAFAGGVAKSVFETKDFLFGDTPPEEQGAFRRAVETDVKEKTEDSILNGFSAGIGQFAGAMVGIGKAQGVAKSLPWVGAKVGAVLGWSKGTTEVVNAATAGAIAFDPHEERLSNLVQGTPLANPLTAWLAADPDDTEAEGRLKAAIESIGLDVAIGTTFLAAGKIYKALRKGDTEAASKAVDELEAQQAKAIADEETVDAGGVEGPGSVLGEGDGGSPAALPEGDAAAGASVPDSLPSGGRGADVTAQVNAGVGDNAAVQGAEEAVPVEVVSNPTSVAASLGEKLPAKGKPRINLEVEEAESILEQATKDREAIAKYGGWYQAMENGHEFGKGEGINYRRLNTDADMDDLMARMVDAIDEQRSKIKGGKVLSDEAANKRLEAYAVAFGEDPAAVLGAVQQAGKMGPDLTARMEAGYILAERTLRDAWRLNQLYKAGDATQFGGPTAMRQEIAKRMSVAASMFAHADSLKSNYARGMRRMAFFNDYSKIKDMDMDKVFDLLDATGGDPAKFKKIANPDIWSQIGDYLLYLRINNMVSGPVTQLINVTTSGAMLGLRPMQRMLGAVTNKNLRGTPQGRTILREAAAQYAYMGNAFTDGFFAAGRAFLRNDSVLAPHKTELYGGNQAVAQSGLPGTQPFNGEFFRPWTNPGNVIYNALSVATAPIGMPTRLLGTVDELVKQTTYRSKLMARAHVEAVGLATDAGLTGRAAKDFVKAHVTRRVNEGFDSTGRGTDPGALHEAQVSTFQQELLPNTVGKWVQNGTSNIKALRLVLPFVKTPTNVIREGWRMTPGLNLLQKEYKEMLNGSMGPEQQAQAMGQMSMGYLFMGATAFMAANGMITGGGPKDPKLKAELMATGWKPYSFVWENAEGGKSYVTFGRFDPVAVPMGIVADLMDAWNAYDREDEPPELSAAIGALGIALAKQFTSKSYLLGATQTMEFMMDPETRWGSVGGNMATSFIPYSAAMRQLNPDDYLRDAQSITDKLMATVPGLSESVPARYDAFGNPVLSRNGLWSSSDDQLLSAEMQRLVLESGRAPTRVSPNMNGVDLRDITLSNGKNAYEEYQRLSGKPTPKTKALKDVITKFIQTDTYLDAPDGDQDVRGTKLWLLFKYTSKYRQAAAKRIKADPVMREALMKETVKVRDAYKARRTGQPVERQSGIDKLLGAFGANK